MKDWTSDDVRELRKAYSSTDSRELASRFGVSTRELERKASEFALAKNKSRFKGNPMPRWSEEQLSMLEQLYPTTTSMEIARRIGRSLKSVNSKASELGLTKAKEHLKLVCSASSALRRKKPRSGEQEKNDNVSTLPDEQETMA